jgi:hypothetical protein
MLYSCFTHALLTLYSCFTHALLMLYSCFTHALLMLYSCFTHALLMLYSGARPSPSTPVAVMHVTLTDIDLTTPTVVPLLVELNTYSEAGGGAQTIMLTAASSTDQPSGQFTGSMWVYSKTLATPLPHPHLKVEFAQQLLFSPTSNVCGLQLLVYEGLSYLCMRP